MVRALNWPLSLLRTGPGRQFSLVVLVTASLLAAGCGGGERLRDIYFSLASDVPRSAESARLPPVPGTLRVSPLAARGFIGGSRIVYRTSENPLQAQRYSEFLWEEVPARAIADDILAALRAGRVFENVVTAGDPARADYLLTGEVMRFEHLPTARPPVVSAEWSLALVDGRSRQLLVSKTYSGIEPTVVGADGRTTPEAMVAAFNRLSGRLIGELMQDAQTMPRHSPSRSR
ncbi:MAG: ABC-type transport auxiliary lipoprotein family protein [Thiohalocapsa sp.]